MSISHAVLIRASVDYDYRVTTCQSIGVVTSLQSQFCRLCNFVSEAQGVLTTYTVQESKNWVTGGKRYLENG